VEEADDEHDIRVVADGAIAWHREIRSDGDDLGWPCGRDEPAQPVGTGAVRDYGGRSPLLEPPRAPALEYLEDAHPQAVVGTLEHLVAHDDDPARSTPQPRSLSDDAQPSRVHAERVGRGAENRDVRSPHSRFEPSPSKLLLELACVIGHARRPSARVRDDGNPHGV